MEALLESHKAARPFFTEEHYMFHDSIRKFMEKEAVPYYEQWEKDKIKWYLGSFGISWVNKDLSVHG